MAKLYYTKDVKEIFEKKFADLAIAIVDCDGCDSESTMKMIRDLRAAKGVVSQVIHWMENEDGVHDAEMERWRQEQEAEKNGTDS